MMKTLHRPNAARIHRADAWKVSAYAFVPYETHFGELCGFADDVVAPGHGFGMHPHRDMEISTIMIRGAQRHQDTTGAKHLLGMNTVQTMSAGRGIEHSEVNASETEPFHSFQVWVYPKSRGGPARHETFQYRPADKHNKFLIALSPDRRDGSALIEQDAFVSVGVFDTGENPRYAMHIGGNGVYVHCASGAVDIAGHRLGPGDAIGIWETDDAEFEVIQAAELVAVEVPMARGVRV